MKIVVIGGSGLIGSKLVNKLREGGHDPLAASPDSGVDSLTGEGVAEALKGARVVVDVVDAWPRALAPSDELRRWFAHRPERFDELRRRHVEELRQHADEVAELRRRARAGKVTLVYAARDSEHSNAAVLAPIIRGGFPRSRSSRNG
jgi:uncharacterized protein YeaO (DUF488 family)